MYLWLTAISFPEYTPRAVFKNVISVTSSAAPTDVPMCEWHRDEKEKSGERRFGTGDGWARGEQHRVRCACKEVADQRKISFCFLSPLFAYFVVLVRVQPGNARVWDMPEM